ncbi:MAG: nuclear transport factor 2 family protein [Gemmatimonadota bacterium]
MSQELVRGMFKAIDENQFDHLEQFFHKDIIYERPGYEPLIGLPAVMHFYREVRVLASGRHGFDAIVIDGEQGACWGRWVGIKKDGTLVDLEFADCYTFAKGKLKHRKSFFFTPLA